MDFPCSTLLAEVTAPAPTGDVLFVNHLPSWQAGFEYERELQAVTAAEVIEEYRRTCPALHPTGSPTAHLPLRVRPEVGSARRPDRGLCTNLPDPELIKTFRDSGGEDKPVQGGMKVCVSDDVADARATAHRLWKATQLPGELCQVLSPRNTSPKPQAWLPRTWWATPSSTAPTSRRT